MPTLPSDPLSLADFEILLERFALIVSRSDSEDFMLALFPDDSPAQPARTASPARAMTRLIQELSSAFPSTRWQSPNQTVCVGADLPHEFHVQTDARNARNLLEWAMLTSAVRPKDLRWLVASGFDPHRFNEKTKVTPIGLAAYKGHASALREMRRLGVDLTLRLLPEHTSATSRAMAGTTLLHRVVLRHRRYDGGNAQLAAVVDELLIAGLNPYEATCDGRTVLDCSDDLIRPRIERFMARKQSIALSLATTTSPRARRPNAATPRPNRL